jgi:iron uptake system component EfeO
VSSGGKRRGRRGATIAAAAAGLALAASGRASSGSRLGGSSGTAASSDQTTTVTIDLTPQGCTPKPATITAGAVQFNVTNKDAGSVSEAELRTSDLAKILGEQDNLTPGLSGGFSPQLQPGSYKINCPARPSRTRPSP